MASSFAAPLIVRSDDTVSALRKVPLKGPESTAVYNEDWLQKLLYRHPEALPVREIEDAFAGAIPLCREMGLQPAGDADIVYVTPSGRLVVVEAKLWRNPEARRKVISQILDYAKELAKLDFDSLDRAVRSARQRIDKEDPPKGLIEILESSGREFDEAEFRDALTRNLKRGDMLLLIVGDGIREGAGALTSFLESFASLHFTFGLVEVGIYQLPEGGQLVQPRVLAQSTIVRRVVVEFREGQVSITEEDAGEAAAKAEEEVSEEVQRGRERFRKFWEEFLSELVLETKEQPISAPATSTNQYFTMPKGSNAWVSAYLMQSGERAGVYLTFSKGPIGNRMYEALEQDKEAIEKEIGIPIEWDSDGHKHWISAPEVGYSGQLIEDNGPAVRAMMADRVNRFVKVFRPRLQKLVEQGV